MKVQIKDRLSKIEKGIVSEGYKKTKVGIIPEDWDVKRLKNEGGFFRGKGITRAELKTEGLRCVTYGEIYTKYNYIVKDFTSKISKESAEKSVPIRRNDIIFTGSGETLHEIGKCVSYMGKDIAYAGGDTIIFRPNNSYGGWLGYLLNSDIINQQKYRLGQGHSVVHIYVKDLETLKIPLPPLQEQEKIAHILSTWDKAIEGLEKLIKEKENQKKGLMQQLLTGERRLPGFSGEWEEDRFDKIFTRLSSRNYQIKTNEYLDEGLYPVVDQGEKKIIAFTNEKAKLLKVDSKGIILFGDHTREIKFINFDFVIGADGTQLIKTQKDYDTKFYYYNLLGKMIPNTGYNRHFKFIKEMKFFSPPIPEQKAIAEILATADKEIDLLKDLLENRKLEKKGLMQLLLTGIVRV